MSNDAARYLTVRLEHATVRRGARAVLRDVSWTVRPGERWLLAGANGAGKTQLLKVVAGIVWPAPAPKPVPRYRLGRHEALTPYGIKDEIAYLGAERQDKYERCGWDVSAARIVGTGLYRTDVPLDVLSAADARRVRNALRALGILHLAQRPFLSLSYGERRVVLLARALASRPRLLLLDEVLNGLDAVNRVRILAWLASRRRQLPWVFATHHATDVPAATSHALLLQHGRVAYAGTLRRAPLARWLGRPRVHPAQASPAAPARGRRVLRRANARVYLNERRVLNGLSLSVRAGEW